MKRHILFAGSLLFASLTMQSCLDFDNPGDELGLGDIQLETPKPETPESEGQVNSFDEIVFIPTKVDTLNYRIEPTEEGVKEAINNLQVLFAQSKGGVYWLRGGKNGEPPAKHAYQRQYSFGPDGYAGYFTIPHYDFMYGKHTSTYDLSADFNGDALGNYTEAKKSFMPLLHSQYIDSIPEIKAINLLYYSLAAQERADLAGPFTYFEDKQNLEDPRVYNNVRSIYYSIVQNLDSIVVCLSNYENRPDWYKGMLTKLLDNYYRTFPIHNGAAPDFSTYIRLANSLKLRMAMHIVKVEPKTAKTWAEEAVKSGVIEAENQQQGLFPLLLGVVHPLVGIFDWGDLVLSASLETLMMSLDHPYTEYVFDKNNNDIYNEEEEEILVKGSRVCGLRLGTIVGTGQDYNVNQLQGFSKLHVANWQFAQPPLYFVKWAEVDFLRAEGALRGWDMGNGAQFFYERGIRNGYLEDPLFASQLPYKTKIEEYIEREDAIEYWYVDPTGETEAERTPTTIGVKWNDQDSKETKLEKIITQKYLALFPLSTEAWTELRRTGYPKLFPVLNTDDGDGSVNQGEIIRRIPWVPTDSRIQDIVNQYAIPALGNRPDEQATRLWWDKEGSNFPIDIDLN